MTRIIVCIVIALMIFIAGVQVGIHKGRTLEREEVQIQTKLKEQADIQEAFKEWLKKEQKKIEKENKRKEVKI